MNRGINPVLRGTPGTELGGLGGHWSLTGEQGRRERDEGAPAVATAAGNRSGVGRGWNQGGADLGGGVHVF